MDTDRATQQALAVIDEFEKIASRESFRTVAVVAAAAIEPFLSYLVLDRMIEKYREKMTSPDGALGSFSAAIDLAAALGLIADQEARELHLIRKIRNYCAHEVLGADPNKDPIRSRCVELTLCDGPVRPKEVPLPNDPAFLKDADFDFDNLAFVPEVDLDIRVSKVPSERFVRSVKVLIWNLGLRRLEYLRSTLSITAPARCDMAHYLQVERVELIQAERDLVRLRELEKEHNSEVLTAEGAAEASESMSGDGASIHDQLVIIRLGRWANSVVQKTLEAEAGI